MNWGKYLEYVGVFLAACIGMAINHYWPDQKEFAGAIIGIAIGWLGKHLMS